MDGLLKLENERFLLWQTVRLYTMQPEIAAETDVPKRDCSDSSRFFSNRDYNEKPDEH